jgi:hypothetical protein
MLNKIAFTLMAAMALATTSLAQDVRAQQSRFLGNMTVREAIDAARSGKAPVTSETLTNVRSAYKAAAAEDSPTVDPDLAGSWYVKIPGDVPEHDFYSLQSFHQGGTFSEASSLLPQLAEAPAHGVWGHCVAHNCILTFDVLEFDPMGQYYGRLRLRTAVHIQPRSSHFTAEFLVDFIENDGTVIPDIGSGTMLGQRLQLLPN